MQTARLRSSPAAWYLVLSLFAAGDWGVCVAAPPAVSSVRPLAAQPGATTELTLRGARLGGVITLQTSFGATADVPAAEGSGDRPADRLTVPLLLSGDAPLGIHALRVWGADGVSSQRLFIVDDLPNAGADGGATDAANPRVLVLPSGVDGTIRNLERHYFEFEAAAGQRVAFEVLAKRIGSTLDPTIVLSNDVGRELVSCDDTPGLGGDCQLVHTFEQAGRYRLELRDVRYRGGDGAIYRLRVGDFPCVQSAVPLAVQRGVSTTVRLAGLDAEHLPPVDVSVPTDWPFDWYAVPARFPEGRSSGFAIVAVSDRPEAVDQEPNDTREQAQPIETTMNVNGCLQTPGDVDSYRFTAAKGARLLFTGVTRREGTPTDLVLRLLDAEGKQLARADDEGVEEGRINHTFAADGEYVLEVSELLGRGGPAAAYRVTIEPNTPGFSLTAEGDALNVPAGGSRELVVPVQRRDFGGQIDLTVESLPAGCSADPVRIGPGMKQGVLTITAAPDAAPTDFTAARVVGTAVINGQTVRETAGTTSWARGQWNQLAVVPPSSRDRLSVSAAPKGRLALQVEPVEVVFGRDLKASVTVTAQRGEGIDDEIKLATLPEKEALPGEVALALKSIPKGESSVTLEFTAKEKAPLGAFSVVLVGSVKQDKEAFTAPTPAVNFRLEPPLAAKVEIGEPKLAREATARWRVAVVRNPALSGPVKLAWKGLPKGVTAAETELPADASEIEVEVTAAADAAAGEAQIVLVASAGEKGKFSVESKLPKITVE